MIRPAREVALAFLVLGAAMAVSPSASDDGLTVWRLANGHVFGPPVGGLTLPVGSLLKPFVAKAWVRSHPGERPPRRRCDAASGCWRPGGHGEVGLARAIVVSCNTYFLALATATSPTVLEAAFREDGFQVTSPLSPEGAVGLGRSAVAIGPDALLRAYVRLTREPWSEGEAVRQELLAGLRESARAGTAAGIGRRGYWAKTGTIPAIDGRPLHTSGLALAVDDAGDAALAFLRDGTGREAARSLGPELERRGSNPAAELPAFDRGREPAPGGAGRVSVALLEGLRPKAVLARNLGDHPLQTSHGYVGPGATTELRPGDRLAEGHWSLALPALRFRREVVAKIACDEGKDGVLQLRADMPVEEYVAGVLDAELPGPPSDLRIALGAAVLRFLGEGRRHALTDVCDSTHCAWFIGRGPSARWPTPRTPVLLALRRPAEDGNLAGALTAPVWSEIRDRAREAGPSHWTSHCGGEPLSPHAVWGTADRRTWACVHRHGPSAPWTRPWSGSTVAAAFGPGVREVAVVELDGVWTLRVETGAAALLLRYDDAHRRLGATMGWDALPSPAARVVRDADGWRAEGVGFGHRVGLCLSGNAPGPTP